MIVFKTLTLRNFMSYGNNVTVFNLDRPGTTLIVGENLDNTGEGQGSNGVGKTSMLQGLVYALYDRIIGDDVTKDGLINDINKKEMEVTLDFVAESGIPYRIVRQRKMKPGAEGNKTILYENGTDISVDVSGTNKKIEEVLGMPYELFVRIIVFSASNDSFLRLPVTSTSGPNQRDFIEDLFGLSVITQKAEKLKGLIKDTKLEMEQKKTQLEAKEAERAKHQDMINRTTQRLQMWEAQRDSTIASLTGKLNKIDGVDIDGQRVIHQQLSKVDKAITELVREKQQATREWNQHVKLLAELDAQIGILRENKCPHCKQQYAGAQDEIAAKEERLAEVDRAIEDFSERLAEHDAMLADLNELHESLSSQVTVDNVDELARIQSDVDNIRARVSELQAEVNPHQEVLDELQAMVVEAIDYTELNQLQRVLDHQNFLLKLLTKSDSFLRKSLLNKYIPFLNGRLQYYLQMLGLPHTVEFQEDLTAKIARMGVETRFGNLSTGQKARVNFAFAVAFKDVRERLHGRTNVCMFDEVLDFGLDAVGVMACAKVIKHIARTEGLSMYVISHRNEIDSVFDKKMTIQMVKQFSYVKEEIT